MRRLRDADSSPDRITTGPGSLRNLESRAQCRSHPSPPAGRSWSTGCYDGRAAREFEAMPRNQSTSGSSFLPCWTHETEVPARGLSGRGVDRCSDTGSGRYTFYRLSKRDLGTIEAVEAICRRWNLSGRRVSYAGLKDRHAATIQYLTIADGPAAPDEHAPVRPRARRAARSSRIARGNCSAIASSWSCATSHATSWSSAAAADRGHPPGRPSQLLRRSAVRVGGLRRRIHRPGVAGRRSRTRAEAGDGGGESLRPLGGQGGEGDPARPLGRLGRGEAALAAVVGPQHRDVSRRSSGRLSRGVRSACAGTCGCSTSRRSRAISGTCCSPAWLEAEGRCPASWSRWT